MSKPLSHTTIAELIHSLGPRRDVQEQLNINNRTLIRRMEQPETFTLGELQRVAKVAKISLSKVIRLAEYQITNQIEPPAAQLGRPFRD